MLTLRHLIASFIAETKLLVRAGNQSVKTLGWYENQFKHFAALGDFPADTLRLCHLAGVDLTNAITRALKRLYRWAAAEELVPKDPFVKLALPPCGQRERVLSNDELARLYRASNRAFRRLLFVQFHTIARPGEIRQLTWGQIDFDRRVIVLTEFKGKRKRADRLKVRLIPLPKPVVRLLKNLHRKSKDPSPAGRVFYSARGKVWAYNGVRCAMRRAREKAGLLDENERVVCYTLRHTGATEMIREDTNVLKVAAIMGHARVTTTERYVHLNPADLVATIDQMQTRRQRRERPAEKKPDPVMPPAA